VTDERSRKTSGKQMYQHRGSPITVSYILSTASVSKSLSLSLSLSVDVLKVK